MRYKIIFYIVSRGLHKFNKNLGTNVINEAKRKGEGFLRYNAIKIDFQEINGHIFIPVIVVGEYGSYKTIMMLDTGASMTVISL